MTQEEDTAAKQEKMSQNCPCLKACQIESERVAFSERDTLVFVHQAVFWCNICLV